MAKKKRGKRTARGNAKKRAERKQDGGDFLRILDLPEGVKRFSVKKAGVKRLDILGYDVTSDSNPYADAGDFHFERTFYTHRNVGPDNDQVVCPKKTFGKKCPICEYRDTLDRGEDEDEIKALSPKERQLFNVIDLADPDEGVQVWEVSYHNFGKKLDAEIRNADEDEDFETFADWEGGQTLKLGFAEKSFAGTKFYEVESIGFKPRKTVYDEETGVLDLDKVLNLLSYEELRKLFHHEALDEPEDADTVDDDEEEAPRKKRKKPEPEEDEDEDDEEEEAPEEDEDDDQDDDDDDPEDDPEDDEDDDEDDEEEEEAPPPPKKSKKSKTGGSKATKKDLKVIKCPGGGTFGKDVDQLDECDDCPHWDACDSAASA